MNPVILPRISLVFLLIVLLSGTILAQDQDDEKERLLRRNWSLFLEYYKMQDFPAALRSGWQVLTLDPRRFQTTHDKMIEIYDSLSTRAGRDGMATLATAYADTVILLIEDNIKNFPDERKKLLLRKGYYYEKLYMDKSDSALKAYEEGTGGNYLETHDYYLDRMARLYAARPEMKMNAITVLQAMLEKDPNNATAQALMKSLITDPEEYVSVLRDAHYADPTSQQKLYELANAFYENLQLYDSAAVYFEKLTKLDSTVRNYWERLGNAYQRIGNYKGAVKSYEAVVKLDPDSKEMWLNLAASYLQEGDLVKARANAERASSLDRSWGRPYMIVAQCYEAAVQRCVESKRGGWDKLKVLDKAVYLLAQDQYAKAAQDSEVADQARSRSKQLESLTPTSEDLFVNRIKKGSTYSINSDCYVWINRSVTMR